MRNFLGRLTMQKGVLSLKTIGINNGLKWNRIIARWKLKTCHLISSYCRSNSSWIFSQIICWRLNGVILIFLWDRLNSINCFENDFFHRENLITSLLSQPLPSTTVASWNFSVSIVWKKFIFDFELLVGKTYSCR